MNKKEISRYTIGIIDKIETRKLQDRFELGKLIDNIQKYNNNPKKPYFLGNLRILGGGIAEFKRYKKITEPSTLEKIDMLTTMYKNDTELKKAYNINTNNTHRIEILYRYNKDIRTLPIVYKDSKSYIDRNILRQYVGNIFAITPELLTSILNNEQIEGACRTNRDEFDSLFALREQLNYNPNSDITSFSRFYSSFITQGGKFNYFNFRLIGMEFKEQDNFKTKEETPEEIIQKELKRLEEEPEQLKMEELQRLEDKEDYESAKLRLTEY